MEFELQRKLQQMAARITSKNPTKNKVKGVLKEHEDNAQNGTLSTTMFTHHQRKIAPNQLLNMALSTVEKEKGNLSELQKARLALSFISSHNCP